MQLLYIHHFRLHDFYSLPPPPYAVALASSLRAKLTPSPICSPSPWTPSTTCIRAAPAVRYGQDGEVWGGGGVWTPTTTCIRAAPAVGCEREVWGGGGGPWQRLPCVQPTSRLQPEPQLPPPQGYALALVPPLPPPLQGYSSNLLCPPPHTHPGLLFEPRVRPNMSVVPPPPSRATL